MWVACLCMQFWISEPCHPDHNWKEEHVCVMSGEINTYRFSHCCLRQLCLHGVPACANQIVHSESKLQHMKNFSGTFQAYYSTTPTSMSQNSSIILNCCSTMRNNELSMCSTQCATTSQSTLWLMSGRGWNEAVSCVSYIMSIARMCCNVAEAVMNIMNWWTVIQTLMYNYLKMIRWELHWREDGLDLRHFSYFAGLKAGTHN